MKYSVRYFMPLYTLLALLFAAGCVPPPAPPPAPDTEGPKVVIKSVSDTNPILVEGRVEDRSGVQYLTVNGLPADIDGNGNFSVEVNSDSEYTFSATDFLNNDSSTVYAAPGTEFDRIMTARVSQEALDFFAAEVAPILDDVVVKPETLSRINFLINQALDEEFWLIGGFVNVTLSGLEFAGTMDIGLDIKPDDQRGVIGFDAVVTEVIADIYAVGMNMSVVVHQVHAVGDAELFGNNGLVGIELAGVSLDLTPLDVQIGGRTASFISRVANAMLPAFTDLMGEVMAIIVNNIMEHIMADIGNEFYADISGATLVMKPIFESFSTDDTTLHVVLGGGMRAETMNESVPPVLGSLYTPTPLPDAPDIGSHMFVGLSSNMVNQAFVSAFQAGIHHLALYNQDTIYLGIDNRPDAAVGTQRWLINPSQPAYFRVEDSGGDPTVFLVMDGLGVQIQKRYSNNWGNMATVDLDVEVAVTLGVNADDTLRMTFAGPPKITANYTKIILLGEIDNNLVNTIIRQFVVPAIMPKLAETTQSVEIPSILGYKITVDDFQALGQGSGHLGVGMTLSKDLSPGAMFLGEGAVWPGVAQ